MAEKAEWSLASLIFLQILINRSFYRSSRTATSSLPKGIWWHYSQRQIIVESLIMQELWWVWMRRCYVPSRYVAVGPLYFWRLMMCFVRFWNQPRRRPSTHMAGWMRDGLWHPRASQRRRIARYRTEEMMQGGPNCPIVLFTRHNLNPSISLILYHGPHFLLLVTSPNFLLLSHSFVGFRFPFPSVFVLCLLFHCFFPSVHRRWHMIWWFLIICSMPYFYKYGYCMERGLGNGKKG